MSNLILFMITMVMDKKSLKGSFPNLYRELEDGENKVSIDAIRKDPQQAENVACEEYDCEEEDFEVCNQAPDKLRHFNPSAVDFICRCDTEVQAEEIIAYLRKKGEITSEYAQELRRQLKSDGVRSFGAKKEENYYFKEGGIC
jgi:hypothetical protein